MADTEVSKEAKDLISSYHHNQAVYDEDYDLHPLYALLRIMTHARKCAYAISRKHVNSYGCGDTMRENYIIYRSYMKDFQTAYNDFIKHFQMDDELSDRLEEAKVKLAESIAVGYDDNVYLMIDIFDTFSSLYGIEGIEYAR